MEAIKIWASGVKVASKDRLGMLQPPQTAQVSNSWVGQGTTRAARVEAGPAVGLVRSRLRVQSYEDRGVVFLDVQSDLDPRQSFLLPLAHRPVLAGVASFTPVGRMHAVCWALAYGVGVVPVDAFVRFGSDRLRYATTLTSAVHQLAPGCWVADAVGVFNTAVLVAGSEQARVCLTAPCRGTMPRPDRVVRAPDES